MGKQDLRLVIVNGFMEIPECVLSTTIFIYNIVIGIIQYGLKIRKQ